MSFVFYVWFDCSNQYRSSHDHFMKGNHSSSIADMKRVKDIIHSITTVDSLLRAAVDIKLSSLLVKCGDLQAAEQSLTSCDFKGKNGPYFTQQLVMCQLLQGRLSSARSLLEPCDNPTLDTNDSELIAGMYCLQVIIKSSKIKWIQINSYDCINIYVYIYIYMYIYSILLLLYLYCLSGCYSRSSIRSLPRCH